MNVNYNLHPARCPRLRRIVLTWLSTGRGGAEQSVRELAAGLSAYGLEVTVVWWSVTGERAGPQDSDVTVRQVAGADEHTAALAGSLFAAAGDTVVISNHRTALVDVDLCRRWSVPVIPVLRALLVPRHPVRVVDPSSHQLAAVEPEGMPWLRLAAATCWVGVSNASARSLMPYLPSTVPVRTIYNGVRVTPGTGAVRARSPGQALRCAAVARAVGWKRVAALIDAFAALTPDTARLDVYGGGPHLDRLRAASTRLAVSVRLHGHVTDLHNRLRAADVLVSAARLEAFGRGIAEAAALARPAVVPAGGASTELVLHGLTGWLYHPDDPSALPCLIADLAARDPAELAAAGRRAQIRADGLFTPRRCAAEYLDLCHAVATVGHAGPSTATGNGSISCAS
jgi:glycosyltransferase involved in cell wall biosynthesis